MQLTIVDRDDEITQVALNGRLDVAGMHEVDIKFHEATAARKRPTIVELSDVDFIASLGVGMLFGCAKSLARGGQKMVLLNPQGTVANVLRTSKMDRVMPIARDEAHALQLLQN